MIKKLRQAMGDDEDISDLIEGHLEDAGKASLNGLTLTQLNNLYKEAVYFMDDEPDTRITGKSPAREARAAGTYKKKYKKETKIMEQFDAEVILDKRTRTVTIHIEDGDGKFLTQDGKRHERSLGAEMPLYMSLPQEIYEAIRRA